MSKTGISYSSLKATPELKDNVWFKVLHMREQLALLYTRVAKPQARTFDVSQTVGRIPAGSSPSSSGDPSASTPKDAHIASTLVTGSVVWSEDVGRLFTCWDLCNLQCVSCAALPGADAVPRRNLSCLAGDAFCGVAFSAILLGVLRHLPTIPEGRGIQVADEPAVMFSLLIWADYDEDEP